MKYFLCLLSLLSLFSLIYSACESGKVNVSGDDTEKCGTAIPDCVTYDVSSSSTTPKCAACDGKIPSSDKSACEACAAGKETKDGKNCYTIIADCEEYAEEGKCKKCIAGKETKDGKKCYTIIADCEEYAEEGKCATCNVAKNKIPVAVTGATCEACADGKETKDGKNCYTPITDCSEYEAEGKCSVCENNKVPKSDKSACEACPDGKKTTDGKTCVENNNPSDSSTSFIQMSIMGLLVLFNVL